jgi:hypothetical protein
MTASRTYDAHLFPSVIETMIARGDTVEVGTATGPKRVSYVGAPDDHGHVIVAYIDGGVIKGMPAHETATVQCRVTEEQWSEMSEAAARDWYENYLDALTKSGADEL